jgi:replicative DNA helicase
MPTPTTPIPAAVPGVAPIVTPAAPAVAAAPVPPVAVSAPAAVIAALPEEPAVKFLFDSHFQTKIAALLVRDNEFMARTDGLVRPEYFEDASQATLVDFALNYYTKYKRLPADKTIYGSLFRTAVENRLIKPELLKAVIEQLNLLVKADISDREYVADQVATFARHQAVAAAIEKAIPKLDSRDFDGITKLMRAALDVGIHVDTNEYDYSTMLANRTGDRMDRAAGIRPPTGISTGYPALDHELYHKGWGRRELSALMGGAKSGKTTAMIDFGINATALGFNVLYVTLEVSADIIGQRMDANISERAIFELGSHIHDVKEKVELWAKKAGKFKIFEFPTGSMRVTDLRRLIERQKAKGIKFDLVILDYADLMAPERYTDNMIENSKSVYVALRGLAMQENVALLTATQTNRQGSTAAVAKAEHVSDDFNKIRIADIIISINRTEEERAQKQARLFFAASRNSSSGFSLRIEQALDRMKFISKVLGTE